MRILILLLMIYQIGCATAYQPMGATGGYTDRAMGSNRWLVTFKGNGYTRSDLVEEYVFQRAQEVCKENGFTDFEIQSPQSSTQTTPTGGYTTQCYGRQCTTSGPVMINRHVAQVVVLCKK